MQSVTEKWVKNGIMEKVEVYRRYLKTEVGSMVCVVVFVCDSVDVYWSLPLCTRQTVLPLTLYLYFH